MKSAILRVVAVVSVCLFMAFGAAVTRADQINASSTGLTSPTQTLTFDELVLPTNTSLTNQYAAFGVTFSPNVFYSPQTNFGNVQGNDVGNFTFAGDGPINPVTFNFSSVLSAAAFSFEADVTPYLFEALLGGSVVESFTATVGFGSTNDFYGFSNSAFDAIRITQTGAGGGPFWLADNLQFGAPVSAAPEPGTLFLVGSGLIGLAAIARRRQRRA